MDEPWQISIDVNDLVVLPLIGLKKARIRPFAPLRLHAGGGSPQGTHRRVFLWILASFASKQTLQMATLFYAEPFVALLSILGWMRLRECRDALSGWILLGASGLFKVEGLVLLLAVWVAFGIDSILRGGVLRSGFVCRKFLAWITRLVFASFAPLLWIVGCHFAGARFYDYAPFWNPDFAVEPKFRDKTKEGAAWLMRKIVERVKYCPYCNAETVYSLERDDKGDIKSAFDHFFPQGRYPFLAISLYNLIPSCYRCNSQLNL